MGWLLVNSLVDAYELKEVALEKTTARRRVKIIPLLAKIKEIRIKFSNDLICITDSLFTTLSLTVAFVLMPVKSFFESRI